MVKHIVLWKIRDDDQKQKNIDHMVDILTSLVGKIEGLVSMEMGYNFNEGSEYDVALYATFKNTAALKYYQKHPEHLKCKEFVHSVAVGRTAADYFLEEAVRKARPFDKVPDAPADNEPLPDVKPGKSVSAEPAVKREVKIEVTKSAEASKPAAPTAPAAPKAAPATQSAAPNSTVVEKKNIFGKTTLDVQVTPLEQRGDTWTCPKCGKIMPKYVGTCGCGEPQPFSFDDDPPALQNFNTQPAAPAAPAPSPIQAPAVNDKVVEKKNIFGKKTLDVEVTPLEQRGDTWTCPKCGKIMPKYVGTCGCGEPQPFIFDDEPQTPAPAKNKYDIGEIDNGNSDETEEENLISDPMDFSNAAPSIENYSPQTEHIDRNPDPKLNYIKNDQDQVRKTAMPFGNNKLEDEPAPFNFDDVPPAAPMKFSDTIDDDLPDFNFDDAPPPAPMRFDDAPPEKPMRFSDEPPAAMKQQSQHEKKHLFGKKAREAEVMRKAEEAVQKRKDVPNDGTWTCPKCGKVMPKYVGTCGCGERQPFDF